MDDVATSGLRVAAGEALSQTFLSRTASFLRLESGDACVASAAIPIADSRYVAPDGERIPFERIVRSRAASVQYVAPVGEAATAPFFRIQFKYSPRPGAPATLDAGGTRIDLAPLIEPSGDSAVIADPVAVAAMRGALERGAGVAFRAISRDTGRRVEDSLARMAFRTVDLCRERAGTLAERAPAPRDLVSITVDVEPTGVTRVAPETARVCGMAPAEGTVHRGLIRETNGFFAQSRVIYAVFDEDGSVAHLYAPGVFEARASGAGVYAADVSIAANGNAPTAPNRVSGCLGAAPTTLCRQRGPDGATRLAPCAGALLAGEPYDDMAFLIAELTPEDALSEASDGSGTWLGSARIAASQNAGVPAARATYQGGATFADAGAVFGAADGGFGGGGGGARGDDGFPGGGEDALRDDGDGVRAAAEGAARSSRLTPIPAPPALPLAAAALLTLLALRGARRA